MKLRPDSTEHFQKLLSEATKVSGADLSAIDKLIEHVPEDMTATVQAGMSLETFQKKLATGKQWLPVDPPHAENLSIGKLLSINANGPRRFGFGTIRDWIIGLTVVLPDGQLVRNGGKVVKNVAGFDLCRLFINAHGTLGFIIEATFKLLPLPQEEIFLKKEYGSIKAAEELFEQIWHSDLQPCVLDLHRMNDLPLSLVIGFSGTKTDVESQSNIAREMGLTTKTDCSYDLAFRSTAHHSESVAPCNLFSALRQLTNVDFVARAGNGVFYVGKDQAKLSKEIISDGRVPEPSILQGRVKDLFDPNGKLPSL
ncbi:MAG: FAD-binding oxidoreductase [Verrucomicrobiota bacterium]|nr:FAD-binding oxidoreductase [Verrucomicrobiota bacterium]